MKYLRNILVSQNQSGSLIEWAEAHTVYAQHSLLLLREIIALKCKTFTIKKFMNILKTLDTTLSSIFLLKICWRTLVLFCEGCWYPCFVLRGLPYVSMPLFMCNVSHMLWITQIHLRVWYLLTYRWPAWHPNPLQHLLYQVQTLFSKTTGQFMKHLHTPWNHKGKLVEMIDGANIDDC